MSAGNWIAVHAGRNYRVYNARHGTYHRGSNGTVRVYTTREPAQRRADRLNGPKPATAPVELEARALTFALTGVE
jgi:hypothetical protein